MAVVPPEVAAHPPNRNPCLTMVPTVVSVKPAVPTVYVSLDLAAAPSAVFAL